MSVEEARAEALDAARPIRRTMYDIQHEADLRVRENYATFLDRLILEARAEMPCRDAMWPVPCQSDLPESLCPSCTARMKLKETTDAHPCE